MAAPPARTPRLNRRAPASGEAAREARPDRRLGSSDARAERAPRRAHPARSDARTRRMLAHDGDERFDRVEDALNAPEGQGRGAEGHDLTVGRVPESPHDPDRIRDDVLQVERGVEVIQALLEELWPARGRGH